MNKKYKIVGAKQRCTTSTNVFETLLEVKSSEFSLLCSEEFNARFQIGNIVSERAEKCGTFLFQKSPL
jgi:hypothetical protein